MVGRCYYKCNNRYYTYGARGIKICDEWLNDRTAFFEWAMENGYNDSLTIDRIDVNGNYEPSNCRWVSQKIQDNDKVAYKGETNSLKEWSKILGINYGTLINRLFIRGQTIEDAFEAGPDKPRDNCKEKSIENRLRRFLAENGIYSLGIVKQKRGKHRPIGYHQKVFNGGYMCTPGVPDLSITVNGIDIQIECKAENGLPSIQQKRIISQILDSGGYAFILKPSNYDLVTEFIKAVIYHDEVTKNALYEILLAQTNDIIDGPTRAN